MSEPKQKASSPLADAIWLFVRNKPALIAFCMIVGLGLAAISGSMFAGKRADANDLLRMEESELVGDRFKTESIKVAILDPQKTELKDTFERPYIQTVIANLFGGFDDDSADVIGKKDRDRKQKAGAAASEIKPLTEEELVGLRKEGLSSDKSTTYWLGTDHLGRDVLARLWSGSTISLTIGFLAVGISVFLGISLGGIAGYFGRNRVGLPMFATILLFLAWGVMLAADITVAAWVCFVIGAGLFVFQFLLAVAGGRWRTVGFVMVAGLLFGAMTWFNYRTETATPEGALYQEAARTHAKARALLLEVRDYGREVKNYEDRASANIGNLIAQNDLPEWMFASQLKLEVKFRQMDLQVGRFDIEKYRSAQREAVRLHGEQQERADHLDLFASEYESRHKAALAAEKDALAGSESKFRENLIEEGRQLAREAAQHAARAGTFNPIELKKRTKRLREVGEARLAYATAIIEAMDKPLAARAAALQKADDELAARIESGATNASVLRERQFEIEAIVRTWKLAEAEFKLADANQRINALKPIIESYLKRAFAKTNDEAHMGLADLQVEAQRLEDGNKALEDAVATSKTDLKKLDDLKKEKPEASFKALPPFKIQGSNDLIDRRGKMRTAYVTKFDTETKNSRTALSVAETLSGHYRHRFYRFSSHFLTATVLILLLVVAGLALMASAQAAVVDRKLPVQAIFLPTITVDDLVMRFTEIVMTIPVLFLILAILAIFEKDVYITMGVIGLTSWMGTTRFVRAEILSLREQDFVQAARSLGLSDYRIIWRHLVPNAISPVLVSASIGVAGAVLAESTLSFLGIGAKPEQTTWGQILSEGREYIFDAPWLTWIPGLAILVTVLAFNLLGEGLREAFNPKLRGR